MDEGYFIHARLQTDPGLSQFSHTALSTKDITDIELKSKYIC